MGRELPGEMVFTIGVERGPNGPTMELSTSTGILYEIHMIYMAMIQKTGMDRYMLIWVWIRGMDRSCVRGMDRYLTFLAVAKGIDDILYSVM